MGKKKLVKFESEAGRDNDTSESQVAIIHADSLAEGKEVIIDKFFSGETTDSEALEFFEVTSDSDGSE